MPKGKRNSARYKYGDHRRNAKKRGIPFLISFEDWDTIWQLSGKWEQRGARKGRYVMARPGDKGAYEMGNVVICLAEENRAERNVNYPHIGKRLRGKNSKPFSQETRAKMSKAATGRKRVIIDGRLRWAYPEEA